MYKVKTYEKTTRVDLLWDDTKKQRLSAFVSDFDQNAVCELYEAIKQIKQDKLQDYNLGTELYIISINKDRVIIKYDDGYSKSKDEYTIDELEEMINLYSDEFLKVYGVDLREVDEDYEPYIEGIIDPSLYKDERIKTFC